MSIIDLKRLSLNSHFCAALIQSFLSGYDRPCDLKVVFIVLPILNYFRSREKLLKVNKKSKLTKAFRDNDKFGDVQLSGESRLSGYIDRYNFLKDYSKKAIVILYSEDKIAFDGYNIDIKEKLDYKKIPNGDVRNWLRSAYYLGEISSKENPDEIPFILGVEVK